MKTIYANALLSDDKILFWYTGQSPCLDWREFYKDFYYAGIDATEYEKQHTLRIARMGFEYNTENEDYNSLIFDVLAKDFYRQFDISEDSKGEKPYNPSTDVVPKSEVDRLEEEVAILNEKNAGLALACFCDCMANDDCLGHNEWKAIKADVVREIFEEIEKLHLHITNEFDFRRYNELKKIYGG